MCNINLSAVKSRAKFACLAIVVPLLFSCQQAETTQENEAINVMSFNIRYDNPDDGFNSWKYRKDMAANAVLFYDVDILGTQEVLHHQLIDLKDRLLEYNHVGVGREDGKEKGEYSAIFYKKERFTLVQEGNFWLSENPQTAGSKGWDAACERIASWAILREKASGKEVFAINTHFDHKGEIARIESVGLLLTKIDELAKGMPIVLTGDFNAEPSSNVIQELINPTTQGLQLIDSRSCAKLVYGPAWSFHNYGAIELINRPLIDYIFTNNGFNIVSFGVLSEMNDSTYLSDHTPIIAKLKFATRDMN
ncbi:endonuclease [Bacteroidales bacterium]|nr:endonuclease [Bacteroidales bacterium]